MTSWLDRNVSARLMFFIGVFVAPSLVVSDSIISRILQLLMLLSIAFLLGRKIRVFRLLIFALTVIAFNLFSPVGRVLVEVMGITITTGALSLGIKKAISLIGLFILSKIIVRKDLLIPGAIGRHVSLTLNYFNTFSDSDIRVFTVNPIKKIDSMLRNTYRMDFSYSNKDLNTTSLKGGLIVIVFMVVSWFLSIVVR